MQSSPFESGFESRPVLRAAAEEDGGSFLSVGLWGVLGFFERWFLSVGVLDLDAIMRTTTCKIQHFQYTIEDFQRQLQTFQYKIQRFR